MEPFYTLNKEYRLSQEQNHFLPFSETLHSSFVGGLVLKGQNG